MLIRVMIVLALVLILSAFGCASPAATPLPTALAQVTLPPSGTAPTPFPTISPTLSPTATQIPTTIQSPTLSRPPTQTVQPGFTAYEKAGILDFVFIYNPKLWWQDNVDENAIFKHNTIDNCLINQVPPMGPPMPERYYPKIIGLRRWWVAEYAKTALYSYHSQYLELSGYKDAGCLAAQEAILAGLVAAGEFYGGPTATPIPTATPRPALAGFTCAGPPPARLLKGDYVLIVTDSLWLRSAPRPDADTKIKQFQKFAPLQIQVVDGPECTSQYVYWKVEMNEMAEGGQTFSGWMAEGDATEYFLQPYDPR